MRRGDIGYAHLKVMARTAESVGPVFDEKKLLKLAKENSPGKFHFKCMHYRHSVDTNRYNEEHEQLAERRGLRVTTNEDGCVLISGGLDPIGGTVVRNALEALAKPSGAHDTRNREQRMADALVELAESKTDVQLQVTSSVETLLGLVGARRGERVLAADVLPDGRAMGVRLQPDANPAAGLGGDRHGPGRADHQRSAAASPERTRPPLSVARLREAGELVRRTSPPTLDRWRRNRARQPDPALRAAPSDGARGRMAGRQE